MLRVLRHMAEEAEDRQRITKLFPKSWQVLREIYLKKEEERNLK